MTKTEHPEEVKSIHEWLTNTSDTVVPGFL